MGYRYTTVSRSVGSNEILLTTLSGKTLDGTRVAINLDSPTATSGSSSKSFVAGEQGSITWRFTDGTSTQTLTVRYTESKQLYVSSTKNATAMFTIRIYERTIEGFYFEPSLSKRNFKEKAFVNKVETTINAGEGASLTFESTETDSYYPEILVSTYALPSGILCKGWTLVSDNKTMVLSLYNVSSSAVTIDTKASVVTICGD